jgi:hypothetical protein
MCQREINDQFLAFVNCPLIKQAVNHTRTTVYKRVRDSMYLGRLYSIRNKNCRKRQKKKVKNELEKRKDKKKRKNEAMGYTMNSTKEEKGKGVENIRKRKGNF